MRALLVRDLRLALRAGGGFGLGLAFFLIVVVLVPFSVGPVPDLLARIAPVFCGWARYWLVCCRWTGCWRWIGRMVRLICSQPRPCHWKGWCWSKLLRIG